MATVIVIINKLLLLHLVKLYHSAVIVIDCEQDVYI